MQKKITPAIQKSGPSTDGGWLDLAAVAEVEITSEQPEHPIEAALLPGKNKGWRANEPGQQVIRLLFSPAQKITHIHLHFEESAVVRTQQYVLQWSPQPNQPCREIVRQQWNFSPRGATAEIEDHHIDLPPVAVLELIIDPDQGNQAAFASLESMRIG
jgi:hypothetical protein